MTRADELKHQGAGDHLTSDHPPVTVPETDEHQRAEKGRTADDPPVTHADDFEHRRGGNVRMRNVRNRITPRARRIAAALVIALAISACETNLLEPADDRFVVQAYLYAGEPVTDVRITATLPLGTEASVAPPINDAEVMLIKAGVRYALVPAPGDSGYYHYPGDDLVVAAGDVFDLEVRAHGGTATARTVVPPPPDGVTVSPSELRTEGGFWATEPAVVRWWNPNRDWYFVTYRNAELDPEPIYQGPGTIRIRAGVIVSEPVTADSLVIPTFAMRHYGRYDVKVHRVNEEYVQLYMSRRQDTRDLNEPSTNVVNGIGIFTAFNRRGASFELTP